jgi:putative ABC transport system ATP-binding protein
MSSAAQTVLASKVDRLNTPMFCASGVTVSPGGVALLTGVEVALCRGERVAIVGPSGSGKTSLLRILCALDDAPSGDIRLHDQTPEQWGYPQFRRNVCLVDQRPTLFAGTVEENLRRPFAYRSATILYPGEAASQWLMRLGIGANRLQENVRHLSVGEQQRVCLIRALLLQPILLLLDEPTSALDMETVEMVETALTGECERRGLALLVVTHDTRQARQWCHRILDIRPYFASEGKLA